MKKWLIGILWLFLSGLALALPSPHEIEQAVNAGNLAGAESMLREVLVAKPNSAKAHYQLGQVLARQGQTAKARQELASAESIDPTLKFANDPVSFRNLQNRLELAAKAPPSPPAATRAATEAPTMNSAGSLWWLIAALGAGFLLWRLFKRPTTETSTYRPQPGRLAGAVSGSYGSGAASNPMPATAYAPAPTTPANNGYGIGSVVMGGVAGLAAGYGLSKLIEGGGNNAPHPLDNTGQEAGVNAFSDLAMEKFDSGPGNTWGDDQDISTDIGGSDNEW